MTDSRLVGGYPLIRPLSDAGGPTRVFESRAADGTPVAVKLLDLRSAGADQVHRFRSEAALLTDLGGAHRVVRLLDEVAEPPALILEWHPGGTLRRRLHSAGFGAPPAPLDAPTTIRLGLDLCDALAWLHRHGVIHRDVKPGNVLLDADAGAVLADLSIAAHGTPPRSLPEGWIEEDAGTLGYAAPELLREPAEAHIGLDIYGVGATLYEALTGRLPHDLGAEETERALRWRLARGEPPVPLAARGWVGPEFLAAVVMQCLAPDASTRPVDIDAIRGALLSERPA